MLLFGSLGDFPCVDIDNKGAAKKAVEHLIEHDYTSIAMITNAPEKHTAVQERVEGYLAALAEAELDYNRIEYGNYHCQSGYVAMERLLSRSKRPRAVFVASDAVAFGAMQCLQEYGLSIHEQVAVLGFDDVDLAKYTDPPLTTIRLPGFEQGQTATRLLIDAIRRRDTEVASVILPTLLIRRVSCGCTFWIDEDTHKSR